MNDLIVFLIGCFLASFYFSLAERVSVKGEDRHFQVTLSILYFLYVLLGGLILLVLFYNYGHSVSQFIFSMMLYSVLFLIAAVDQHAFIIPDRLQVCLAGLFFFYHWSNGTLLIWLFYLSAVGMLLVSLLTASMVKDGLGGGDIKLLVLFAYGLGFTQASWVLFFASLLALMYIGIRLLVKRQVLSRPIPFGPFLALAFFFVREIK